MPWKYGDTIFVAFEVYTYYKSLTYLFYHKDLDLHHHRWVEFLVDYDFRCCITQAMQMSGRCFEKECIDELDNVTCLGPCAGFGKLVTIAGGTQLAMWWNSGWWVDSLDVGSTAKWCIVQGLVGRGRLGIISIIVDEEIHVKCHGRVWLPSDERIMSKSCQMSW